MKINQLFILISIFLYLPSDVLSQKLNLGSIESFSLYTIVGAVSNSGTSTDTGNIGTNLGAITGFSSPTTVFGSFQSANSVTLQANIDLLNVYINLNNIRVTNITHGAAFGSGETLTGGVYLIASAGSLGGTLTLNGQGNPDAVFIFKFEGAFTAGASSTVVMTNGTRSCNVFWISEGAISVGASSIIKGTLLAHPGAVSLGTSCNIEGRLLSTSGAISINSGVISKPGNLSTIPIECINTCNDTFLKSAANFTLFTSAGAVANTSISGVIGDIGSDVGAISGWGSSVVVGSFHNANSTTAQAKTDLAAAYTKLVQIATTDSTHASAFGSGETLTKGVYRIAAAGSLAGILTLNGQGDTNALFIFKFGGAFSTGANSKVILINGARRCKIFWIAEGAISMGAFTFMKGTTIANNGANNMGANGFIEGRMFSTGGAVGFNSATTFIGNSLCGRGFGVGVLLPIELISFNGKCEQQNIILRWSTAQEINNSFFTVQRSIDGINWEIVGSIAGAGTSSVLHSYSLTDNLPLNHSNYFYKLKQTDFDGKFEYSNLVFVEKCGTDESNFITSYPNPTDGKMDLLYRGKGSAPDIDSTQIFNSMGQKVYEAVGSQTKFDLSNNTAGVYFVYVHLTSKTILFKILKY